MDKEYYMKAIKAEMSIDEIKKACEYVASDIEQKMEGFYHPEIFIDVCKKRINNEINDEYFNSWTYILLNLLNYDKNHFDLAYFFDGLSFRETYSEHDCKGYISHIQDYDLKFNHPKFVKYHYKNKMKVMYIRAEFYDHSNDTMLNKCYIVDHKNKTYDVRMLDDDMIENDPTKNYCSIWDEEYVADIRQQEITPNHVVDCTKPEKQFSEAEEELQDLFFEKKYKRVRNLEF